MYPHWMGTYSRFVEGRLVNIRVLEEVGEPQLPAFCLEQRYWITLPLGVKVLNQIKTKKILG